VRRIDGGRQIVSAKRRSVPAIAVVGVGGVVLGAWLFSARGATQLVQAAASSGSSQRFAVKAAVWAAEDLEVACPYPMPAAVESQRAVFSPRAIPHAWVDAATRTAYIPQSVMTASISELRVRLGSVFAPSMEAPLLQSCANALREQSDGSDVAGSGGASIKKYESVVVEGVHASVQAVVSAWTIQGTVDHGTGHVSWTRADTEILVTDVLAESPAGRWLVTSRQWQFMPGFEP
jgi:hypothetical protein